MNYLIQSATVVNEGKRFIADVYLQDGVIHSIVAKGDAPRIPEGAVYTTIHAEGKYLLPGVIDDQVHFREPGLTHKGEIYTEARAAVAGGITSFMEMPNTSPPATTQDLLEQKYLRAAEVSLGNYSFFMGASNDNLEEILKTNIRDVCGLKIFMGSSTGNMLVDHRETLESIFSEWKSIISLHCEDEATIKANSEKARQQYGEDVPIAMHPVIRSAEACYKSSSFAKELAEKHGTRIHILHISSGIETDLFTNKIPLSEKKITSEACIHHLWFSDADYAKKGTLIKWNPAVKTAADREKIWEALLDGRIDVIATDHAPHTLDEKSQTYFKAPSGAPLVQHSLNAMLEFYQRGKISLEMIVQKMAHNVAELFRIDRRGYIREGYYADLVLADLNTEWTVTKSNILYKCGWSPLEGTTFHSAITHTFVNGNLVYNNGVFDESAKGMRMRFNR
jgi:dihydroorotase